MIDNKLRQQYSELFEKAFNAPIFCSPTWLDIVAKGQWIIIPYFENGKLVAALPFYIRTKRMLKIIEIPPLTPFLGPVFLDNQGKNSKNLGKQHRILEAIIGQLPKTHRQEFCLPPGNLNGLPFMWAGFEVGVSYTYRLNLEEGNAEAIWANMEGRARTAIRKAEQNLVVEEYNNPDLLFKMVQESFERHKTTCPYRNELLQEIVKELIPKGMCSLLYAKDSSNQYQSAILTVSDKLNTYYLVGGSFSVFRKSGANALLLWQAIKNASLHSKVFDFEGSSVPSIEEFFRSFGANQTPLLSIRKNTSRFKIQTAMTGFAKKMLSFT